VAGRRSAPPSVAIGVEVVGFIALPLGIWLLPFRLDATAAAFAFAGGVVGGLGLIAFYRAMAMNLIGVVAPVTAVIAASLPVAAGVVLGGERLHTGQLAGIFVGLAAIALINGGGGMATRGARAAVGLAILAGIGFGLFFILYHGASTAGVTAFVSGRIGSAIGAFCFALLSRSAVVPNRSAGPGRNVRRGRGRPLSICDVPRAAVAERAADVVLSGVHGPVRAHLHPRAPVSGAGHRRGAGDRGDRADRRDLRANLR